MSSNTNNPMAIPPELLAQFRTNAARKGLYQHDPETGLVTWTVSFEETAGDLSVPANQQALSKIVESGTTEEQFKQLSTKSELFWGVVVNWDSEESGSNLDTKVAALASAALRIDSEEENDEEDEESGVVESDFLTKSQQELPK